MNPKNFGPVSDFKMEQYLIGALPENEMQELRDREASDEIFAARVAALKEQNEKILAENPFEKLSVELDRADLVNGSLTDAGNRAGSMTFKFGVMKIAAAVIVALGIFSAVIIGGRGEIVQMDAAQQADSDVAMAAGSVENGSYGETRIKGMQARMEIWKKTAEGVAQMEEKGLASEGDELQLRYVVPEKCFGMLISMDGNGVVTVHMGQGAQAIAVEPGKMNTLPFAYKLDDAPHFEKFFLLTSKNEFSVNEKEFDKSLNQEGVQVVSFTVRKQAKK